MWMVSCDDNNDLKMTDTLNCTKLCPTNPMQPITAYCKNPTTTTITPPCSSCSYSPITLPGLHRHAKSSEQSMRGQSNEEQPSAVNSRWSPTPEQLLALEEMYRCGTRTPTADQIQQIAAQLRRYGKIEGKNIFYWFQNHKARERQKRRRQQNRDAQSLDKKDSGLRRTNPEFEQSQQINNLPPLLSCNKHSEGFDLLHGASEQQQQKQGWWQFGERELQEKHSPQRERHATRQNMNWSSMATPAAKVIDFQRPTTLLKTKDDNNIQLCLEDELREIQTLQLFPLRSDDWKGLDGNEKDKKVPIKAINTNFSPNKFFEFLPLKN